LVVTDVSHAGKMAVYLNRPLLVVNMTGRDFPYSRFDEEGVALIARNEAELGQQVHRLLDDHVTFEGRPAFIARHFTSDDGRATERIVRVVLDQAAARRTVADSESVASFPADDRDRPRGPTAQHGEAGAAENEARQQDGHVDVRR
jgi:hypothetical protein